jgi:hypothetical protein
MIPPLALVGSDGDAVSLAGSALTNTMGSYVEWDEGDVAVEVEEIENTEMTVSVERSYSASIWLTYKMH